MKTTCKSRILAYLSGRGWVSGTELEDQSRPWGTKASNIHRRTQELAHDALIERKIGDRGTVQYKLPGYAAMPTMVPKPAIAAETVKLFEVPPKPKERIML